MTAFEALHDLRVSVIKLRSALRRLPGDREREVAAVTLRAPLQQIETAARDIEGWFNAHAKFAAQQIRIIYPTGEGR
jgi:CHAD domain-containing protein